MAVDRFNVMMLFHTVITVNANIFGLFATTFSRESLDSFLHGVDSQRLRDQRATTQALLLSWPARVETHKPQTGNVCYHPLDS